MTSTPKPVRVHLITGGFPPGSPAGHDMDYARLRLLQLLREHPHVRSTVANDFTDVAKWLPDTQLLMTYVAGPYLNDEQNEALRRWLEGGGRWLALHGTSGGKAVRVGEAGGLKKMVKTSHHDTLGSFFLNHPPMRKFRVQVSDREHAVTRGLPASFEVVDELYLIELQEPSACQVLLTTELDKDPSPPGFGFVYDQDTSVLPDGKTRVLGYSRALGQGGVVYIALGHCHSPTDNRQRIVDSSVQTSGDAPRLFRGSWETEPFERLLCNGIAWGIEREGQD
ncbi:MAG TPA: ThuA domain-containing protein [Candidatus Tectomicrobia bacterium]|nr:ThuA domain-containing protein [Candidatus Tectomicrobia bacterium]